MLKPLEVFEAIRRRRSIRRYKKDAKIPEEHILKILEAARLAPSAGNRQPWRFVVVKDPEVKRKLAEACNNQTFIADAQVAVVAIGDPSVSRWYSQDPMIAVEHMVLEATELGYGTCWIGAFNEEAVKKVLNIPPELKVICVIPVGVPDEEPPPRPRKPIEEIFHLDRYGNPYKVK
ncbi:MAG: nitroreductase family protein [Candidatus Bathyarchaeia archaeon]